MHVGHFAAGLIGKPLEPKLSAGTLVLASMLADLLWCVFTLAGIEEVRFGPGRCELFSGYQYRTQPQPRHARCVGSCLCWCLFLSPAESAWRGVAVLPGRESLAARCYRA